MKLFKAMATVAGLTGISRIGGFVRDVMTANILGAGPVADAFFVALKLPNFFRKVTAEGAFSVSFVPKYAEVLEKDGQERAELFASRTFSMMLLWLSGLTLFFMAIMPVVIYLIAPGFQDDPERYDLAVILSRITFPYLLLMSLTALLGGVMNAHDKFGPFAFAPTLFNLSLIVALLCTGYFENAGYAMSWGVFAAGVLQFLYLWISARRAGLKITLTKPVMSDNIKAVFRRMGPGLIGAGVLQINLFADLMIASFLQEGSISYLYYADRLNQLPLGVIGIAVGTALLPMLTREMAANNRDEARKLFNRALEVCLLLGLPAACGLLIIPHLLIQALFEHGAFTASDTYLTGYVLIGYAVGLPAYIGVKVLSSTFWAQGDTKTPVKIAIMTTSANIILGLTLIQFIGVMGITLATGLTGWMQYFLLKARVSPGMTYDTRLKTVFPKILLAVAAMAVFLAGGAYLLSGINEILRIVVLMTGAMAVYAGAILGLNVIKPADFKRYFRRSR
ncbi:MAG: murein biosynthesis integral membrane protein MurJ [Rhodospirillales bacterium]|nr:murein biosynthesis integral membrane protein MurJ [Rhodospirillales bacterium]